MASKHSINLKRGFTLLEMSIVIFLFMIIVTLVSKIYLNLVNSSLIANDYYQALENVRLGTEKVWRILKYGWSFRVINNNQGLEFQKNNCVNATIIFTPSSQQLIYQEGNSATTSIFDPNLVRVKNITIATDRPATDQRYAYFQYAPKIIVINYNLEIISKKGVTSSLEFYSAVAPLNSVYSNNLCQ